MNLLIHFLLHCPIFLGILFMFTPLESPSIYAGGGGNRKRQLLIEGGVKALPFLTGFTMTGQGRD